MTIVNCATMNIGVHRFFWISVSGLAAQNYWVKRQFLICMTHGRELKGGGDVGGRGCAGRRGVEGRKWDNCNSIINKIYFLKNIIFLGNSILFSIVAAPICIPINSALGFPFLRILSNTCFLLSYR